MKFGPAEMAQMMDGVKALITVTMVSTVVIGLLLGVIFRRALHRDQADLTHEQLPTPNSSPKPNAAYPGWPPILVLIVALGGGVLYGQYASQRADIPQRADTTQRPDPSQRPDTPQRAYTTQRLDTQQRSAYAEVYSILGISPLPQEIETNASIRRPLEQLNRERCDKQAIFDLARALQNAGYRRDAAKVDVTFSGMCGGYAPSLRRAANVLLELSDYSGAVTVASELINLEPLYDNGYYLRALAYDGSGTDEKALDDYVTALELVGDKTNIFSTPYFNMARLYEKIGAVL
jgi:tetratricopeptide (TPR) repeat protein